MDQAVSHERKPRAAMAPAGRRSGWSEAESRLLWETADDAQQQAGSSEPMIAEKVGAGEIAEVVASWTGIPVGRLLQGDHYALLLFCRHFFLRFPQDLPAGSEKLR